MECDAVVSLGVRVPECRSVRSVIVEYAKSLRSVLRAAIVRTQSSLFGAFLAIVEVDPDREWDGRIAQ